jgi:pimeloyl-ACP methyl ester carboxylesterase
LAAELAADPAKPRLVLAIDYRGHGQSEYDRNPDNYTLPVALADLSAVLIALEIAPAIFLGTSYGGLLAMMLAVWRPTAIGGAILNAAPSSSRTAGCGSRAIDPNLSQDARASSMECFAASSYSRTASSRV